MTNSLPESMSAGRRFREALDREQPLTIVGAFNPLVARMAQRAGFGAVYQSGAALSAALGLPDVGLVTQTEFAQQAAALASAVDIPVVSDADTGFGEALSVERTVQSFERAGLAGLHLEDQQLPKRCGHLSGKTLVSVEAMVAKLHAAVGARSDPDFAIIARTDARGVDGFDAAVERALRYVDAGADMIFPEALETADEFARFKAALDVPLLANATEYGKSPLIPVEEFGEMGYAAVLFPVTMLRVALKAVEHSLSELRRAGTQAGFVDSMLTRAELYDLLGYAEYEARDREYFGG